MLVEPHSPEQVVLEVLGRVLGTAGDAKTLLRHALDESDRATFPRDAASALSFARAHIIERLSEAVGPRVALAALDELRARLLESARPTVKMPVVEVESTPDAVLRSGTRLRRGGAVLLVDENAYLRTSVARLLVRGGFEVDGVARIEDAETLDEYEGVVVALRRAERARDLVVAVEPHRLPLVVVATDVVSPELASALARHAMQHEMVPVSTPERALAQLIIDRLDVRRARAHSG